MKFLLAFSVILLLRTCNIGAVDYAVQGVRLTQKIKTEAAGKPAVILTVENADNNPVNQIVITVKAKRGQNDLDIAIVKIEFLAAHETTTGTAVLNRLQTHTDYDMLTYAVKYRE